MTALAPHPPSVTAARPVPPRSPHGHRTSVGVHPPARGGGAVVLGLVAAVVVVVVAVLGSGTGHGADLGGEHGGLEPVAARADAGTGDGPFGAGAAVVLGEGETAWEALRPHVPDGAAHEVFVHEVLQANDVDARELRPGDVLVVPGEAR